MRRPQSPPNLNALFVERQGQAHLGKMFENLARPDAVECVRQANEKYLHWDKFRRHPRPLDISAEVLWFAVSLSRSSQRQILPLSFGLTSKLSYVLPPRHLEWLHNIDKEAGGVIGLGGETGLEDDDRYLFNSLMEEAIASSQLEGASTTRKIAKEMLRTNRKPRNKAEQMILNNYRAILEVRELQNEKLTPELLCHLQQILTDKTLDNAAAAGRFRNAEEEIVVIDVRSDEVLHDPPHADQIARRIKEICDFANAASGPFVHPVIKAAVLHFAIGFVHPFVDGNGRTARALFYWYVLKNNYWLFEYVPISRLLIRSQVKYARAYLYTETDSGDVTYFVHFHLQAILQALDSFRQFVQKEMREIKEAAALLESFPGLNHRQRSLISDAVKQPTLKFTARGHQGKYHVTYPTARADLLGLTVAGLLTKTKSGKTWYFYPANDLRKRLRMPASDDKKQKERNQESLFITKGVADEPDDKTTTNKEPAEQ